MTILVLIQTKDVLTADQAALVQVSQVRAGTDKIKSPCIPALKVIESPRIVANIEAVVPEPALKIKKVGFNSQIQTKFFDVMSSESGKSFE